MKQTAENRAIFESMAPAKALAKLAVPTIISQLVTLIYNLADTFFIGKTNDPCKVAAATVASALMFILIALSNLFGVGGSSLISRLLGQQKPEEAGKVSALSFYGSAVLTLLFSLSCLVFMEPLLRLLGASDDTLGYTSDYILWVVVIGGVPTTLGLTMSHLLRSEGYAREAGIGLSLGGIVNIALDPLFMFVLLPKGREVLGAALATMLSNVLSLLFFLIVLASKRGKTVLSLSPKKLPAGLHYLGQTLAVGLPASLGTGLACVSNAAMNALASSFGDVPLAAVGIVKKIDMLPMNVGMGLCQGMMPLVAYNYAAGNVPRMKAFVNLARLWGMAFALLCIGLFEAFAAPVVLAFIREADTVYLATRFLRICVLGTPFMVSNVQMTYTLQAMGKGRASLLLSVCRQGLIHLPILFLFRALFGMYGVVCAQLAADMTTMIVAFGIYHHVLKRDSVL